MPVLFDNEVQVTALNTSKSLYAVLPQQHCAVLVSILHRETVGPFLVKETFCVSARLKRADSKPRFTNGRVWYKVPSPITATPMPYGKYPDRGLPTDLHGLDVECRSQFRARSIERKISIYASVKSDKYERRRSCMTTVGRSVGLRWIWPGGMDAIECARV